MKNLLKKISRKNFNINLEKRETEDLEVIQTIDKLFFKKRGYVFLQPKKGKKVILLLSGGIDSTVAWDTLINIYKYKVYPVFIYRKFDKKCKKELEALRSLEIYFAKKYPNKYIKPLYLNVDPVPKQTKELIKKENISSELILLNYIQKSHRIFNQNNVIFSSSHGVFPYLTSFYGVFYAEFLKNTRNIDIVDIFVGVNYSDGSVVPAQSFTALRTTLLAICSATANYKWNFSSVFLERETGIMMDKAETIRLGYQLGLPLEKTWSCYQHKLFQCGDACATCINRKNSFNRAGVEDKTIYMSDFDIVKLKNIFRKKLKYYYKKLFN